MKMTIKWRESIAGKHLVVFATVILLIAMLTSIIQVAAMNTAREATYERMNAQTGYYLGMLDNEIEHMHSVQLNFFSDRKLMYIAEPLINITDYEKREALLSVKERLGSFDGISNLIGSITLYVPKSEYVITSASAGKMQEEDRERLKQYFGLENGRFYENETEFFMLENGTAKNRISEDSTYLLVVTYPKDKIMKSIAGLEDGKGGGAFFYSEKYGIIQGENTENSVAEDIWMLLKKDEKGNYRENQQIKVNGERYLVFTDRSDIFGSFIQFSKEDSVMHQITKLRHYMYAVWLAVAVLALAFIYYTRRTIHQPMGKLCCMPLKR